MEFTYNIKSFDNDISDMTFMVNNKPFIINLKSEHLLRYSSVHPTDHWVDIKLQDVVIIKGIHNRLFTKIDNELYRKASQFDYDRWENKTTPTSDNAKVYRKLMKYSQDSLM